MVFVWNSDVCYPRFIQFALSCDLRCAHKHEKNNIQVELIRFRKNSDFIDFTNFEVGIGPILPRPMCSLLSVMSHLTVTTIRF